MGESTGISWTDSTWNPWIGCTKVSAECKFCYAEALMDKRHGRVEWGAKGTRSRTSASNWRKPYAWDRKAKAAGVRHKVFCASLADVFEDRKELEPWRDEMWAVIRKTPNLEWQLLTKRPENIAAMLPDDWGLGWSNVWLGTSAGVQATWDERLPVLRSVPAAVHFISMEPMLEAVDVRPLLDVHGCDWIIVGGESGVGARPMKLEWVRDVRTACEERSVPFFFKQKGERLAKQMGCSHRKGEDPTEWPDDIRVQALPASG